MGLGISHNAWHGGYHSFHRWRVYIASLENIPLELMEGYWDGTIFGIHKIEEEVRALETHEWDKTIIDVLINDILNNFPLKWSAFKPSPLHKLFCHSDCDGYINWKYLEDIYKKLEILIKKIPKDLDFCGPVGNVKEKTQAFIDGCKKAFNAKQHLQFR